MHFTETQLVDLRRRAMAGEMLDLETLKKVIEQLRHSRVTALTSAATSKRSKKKAEPLSDQDLFASIDNLLAKTGAKKNDTNDSTLHPAGDDQLDAGDDAGADDDGEAEGSGDALP